MGSPPERRKRKIFGGAYRKFIDRNGFVYSSAISFNVFLSIIPFLFLVSMVAGIFSQGILDADSKMKTLLEELIPFAADVIIKNFHLLHQKSGALGIVGFVALFLATLSFTNAIHISLSVMWKGGERKSFVSIFISHSTIIVGASIVLMGIAVMLSTLAIAEKANVGVTNPFFRAMLDESLLIIRHLLPFVILSLATAFAYRHLSPVHIPIKHSLAGGFAFGGISYLVKTSFVLYLKYMSKMNIIYGSIFSIVCFIIASYLFAVMFLFIGCIIYEVLSNSVETEGDGVNDHLAGD